MLAHSSRDFICGFPLTSTVLSTTDHKGLPFSEPMVLSQLMVSGLAFAFREAAVLSFHLNYNTVVVHFFQFFEF